MEDLFFNFLEFIGTDNANIVIKIINLIICIIGLILAILNIFNLIKINSIKKSINETEKEMEVNKENQKVEEEKMAQMYFLCDKCGKMIKAENGFKYKNFDICESCNEEILKMITARESLKREEEKLNFSISQIEKSILEFESNNKKPLEENNCTTEKTETTENVAKETEEDSILKRLGLKK